MSDKPEWRVSPAPVAYPEALAVMEQRVADIEAGRAPELVWLLEHPPLYTAGTSAAEGELLEARFPVFKSGRGGRFTYHGPGQRVVYVVSDLRKRGRDVRAHVCGLEQWVIDVLAQFGVRGERREGRIGIWVATKAGEEISGSSPLEGDVRRGGHPHSHCSGLQDQTKLHAPSPNPSLEGRGIVREEKIAAIGVRVRKWIAYHGLALNVDPDLSHFSGIVPCGLPQFGVTSLRKLGVKATMDEVDAALHKNLKF